MLAVASKIVRDYGRVLGEIEPGCCALPRSYLPHPRAAIHEATLRILGTLAPEDTTLREALIRGFVFLSQFVDDDEAQRVAEGQAQLDALAQPDALGPSALEAQRVVDRIKLDMEQSLIQACVVAGIPLSQAPSMLK